MWACLSATRETFHFGWSCLDEAYCRYTTSPSQYGVTAVALLLFDIILTASCSVEVS